MSKLQKKIATRLMRVTIYNHVNKTYLKKGLTPTTEQVMQDMDKKALSTLLGYYTLDEIKGIIEKTIRRQLCKGQNAPTKNT